VIGDDGLKAYLSERDRIVAALDLKAYRELGKAYNASGSLGIRLVNSHPGSLTDHDSGASL